MVKGERTKSADIVAREYTIHMSKRLYGVSFKNRAPRAIREIKAFAQKHMNTKYVNFLFILATSLFPYVILNQMKPP